jgi:hypothetical protein
LYRLPELIASDPKKTVFVVEGEKDANRLWEAGLIATCNPGGAGKWSPEYSGALENRHVVVLPDNNAVGQEHANKVARSLHGIATSVRILALLSLPDKGNDVSDWLDQGHTDKELKDMARATPEWVLTETEVTEDSPTKEGPRVLNLGDVEPESVHWLWPGYIAYGKVTLIAGDPGLGKSWATLDLAARWTASRSLVAFARAFATFPKALQTSSKSFSFNTAISSSVLATSKSGTLS